MISRALALAPVGLVLVLAPSCGSSGDAPPPKPAASAPAPATPSAGATAPADGAYAASFSDARAWKHLADQVAMGPRAHGKPGHVRIRQYMRDHLEACGAEVREQVFHHRGAEDAGPEEFTNVMGRFTGKSDEWILLGTHYDTRVWADEDPDRSKRERPIEGANDGASGTAVLLEIATLLKDRRPDVGVEIVFYDGEDYGRKGRPQDYFLGSEAHAAEWSSIHGSSRPALAIVLDMVGDADLSFLRESTSDASCPWLNDRIWQVGVAQGHPAFRRSGTMAVSDDHVALLRIGIPATLLIDFDYPWWHTSGDTIDRCSAESLGVTGRAVLAAVLDQPIPRAP